MIISMHTPGPFHGITIFDEAGEPLSHVMRFCTETYLCHLPNGKRAVAAGYALFPASVSQLRRMLDELPDAMQSHVYPGVLGVGETHDTAAFVKQQLQHRAKLQELATVPSCEPDAQPFEEQGQHDAQTLA